MPSTRPRWGVVAVVVALLVVQPGWPAPVAADGVDRIAGANRHATAAAISRSHFAPSVDTVFVATGTAFPDALAAGTAAATLGGPVLLTRRAHLPTPTRNELTRLAPDRVVVMGGTEAVSADVVATLRGMVDDVDRIRGASRHHTAANLSRATFPPGVDTAWVASGQAFPDALAIAPVAGRRHEPVLLARRGHLPDVVHDELVRLAPRRIVLVGGPAALSTDVAAELGGLADVVQRWQGRNRYDTAATISRRANGGGAATAWVADGTNFPDAVAAGPVAALGGGPILLSRPRSVPAWTDTELDRLDPNSIVVLGGRQALSRDVALDLLDHVDLPPYHSSVSSVTRADLGASWSPGCPVPPADLREVAVRFVGFDAQVHLGHLVVHADVVGRVRNVFGDLYAARFPIRRMRTIDVYDGDDDASMAADNTSAFNCRRITGGSSWSRHSYGKAIDLNPVENPYVNGDTVLPPAGRSHLDRDGDTIGLVVAGDEVVTAFKARGFEWGGDWSSLKDYQHFER